MKHNDKKPKPSPKERFCRMLDISPEAFPHGHAVEILGKSLVKIRGGGAILLYTPDEIRIDLRSAREYISVKGSELSCSSYNRGTLGIEGLISSVSFEGSL